MKLNQILGLACGVLLTAGFASCSNDMNEAPVKDSMGSMLVRAPKAVAYSGTTFLDVANGRTYGTRAGATVTSETCQTTLIDRDKEAEIVEAYLPEKNENLALHPDLDADFLFYADKDLSLEFYPVYSQTSTKNDLGVFYWDAEGNYHTVIVWEEMTQWNIVQSEWKWNEESGQTVEIKSTKGIKINVPKGCTFGFFWKGNLNNETQPSETTYYSMSEKNTEVYCTDGNGNHIQPEQTSKIHAVTFQLEGKTYLGLEDWTDFDFQDWVFTCDQELTTVDASTFVPGQKPDPETPDVNIPDNLDPGFNVDPETPETPEVNIPDNLDPGFNVDPETPEIPDVNVPDDLDPGFSVTPETPVIREEVEINLSLDEKEDDNVRSSHLSIHVRTATDVEVFIPVPAQYYCEADDMAIVMQHELNHMAHGGPTEFTWTLKDSDLQVSLFVQYEEGGIRIWTDGITQEVIDWCYEKCQDGITFEVWNYFNDEEGHPLLSNEELRGYLDQATVTFLDKVPDYYINAFADPNGKYSDENPDGDDFHVTPVNPQDFDAPYEGSHYNNSEVNDIYKKHTAPNLPPVPVY